MTITSNQRAYLTAIANSEFGSQLGDDVWTNCIWHKLDGKIASGTASSLVRKGFISVTRGHGRDDCTRLTAAGIAAVVELGLNTSGKTS